MTGFSLCIYTRSNQCLEVTAGNQINSVRHYVNTDGNRCLLKVTNMEHLEHCKPYILKRPYMCIFIFCTMAMIVALVLMNILLLRWFKFKVH